MMRRALPLLLLATACASTGTPSARPGLVVRSTPIGRDSALLVLEVAPGTRINARLLPTIEEGRDTLRFGGVVDSLGDYFVSAPTLRVALQTLLPHTQVAAGLCEEGAAVCHVVRAPVTFLR